MLRRSSLFSVLGILLLASASAHAGTLSNVTWFQVTQGFPMTRTNAQLGATGTSTGSSVAVNVSYPQFTTQFFVPKTANGTIDLHITITQGGAQAITATASMAMGTPGVPGTVIVMTAQHAAMGADQSMFMVGANTLLKVPLSAGKAGTFTQQFSVTGVAHYMTVDFYAWTPHTVKFTGLTSKGKALPNVTVAGSFNLTPWNGGGSVTLVSPSKISIDGALAQRRTAGFTKLVLNFVPEPGTLLLLGGTALALALARRKRS